MTTPYTAAARDYLDCGWSPIPLPHEEKGPVPDQFPAKTKVHFTGGDGIDVTEAHLKVWCGAKGRANAGRLSYPPSNIALRMPKREGYEILGVDVDAYGTKKGSETFAKAELDWGALPPTWVSTSRDDQVSGIRFFKVPVGLAWPGELPQGKGVELIRWDHRYAIVAPSVHPETKQVYRWAKEVLQDGSVVLEFVDDEIPDADDIVAMPKEWVEGLTSGATRTDRPTSEEIGADEVRRWIAERNAPEAPCSHMRKMLTRWSVQVQKAADDGGAHEEMRDAIWGALNDARAGHAGLGKILTRLRNTFLEAVRERRPDEGSARSEWARAVVRGANKIMSDGNEAEEEDPCEGIGSIGGGGSGSSGSPGRSGSARSSGDTVGSNDIEECNELGNANRLIRVMSGRARWVESHAAWYLWDEGEGRWQIDDDRQVERWAVKAIDQIDDEVGFLAGGEDSEAVVKAYRAHRKTSMNLGARRSMTETVKGRKGILLRAELLDADPKLLGCENGTLILDDQKGVEFRRARFADYTTLNTGTRYTEGAQHDLWDSYLKKFHPDEEVRDWLRRLVGYSLFGINPEQLLVVGLGKTGSGKTTFVEGLYAALGSYAGPLDASVLRASGDDKPRPDIIKVMPKRVVIAEELSEFQRLHVDQLKRITGAGTLSARGMSSNVFVERRAAFTPWIMTNEVPTIEGGDAALRNRVLVVPFDVQEPRTKASSRIRERIILEAREAILAWAVSGWIDYSEGSGDLREIPAGALGANAKFVAEMSDFHAFVAERLDSGDGFTALPTHLFEAYEGWCIDNGVKDRDRLSKRDFGIRMNGLGTSLKRIRGEDGKQIWHRIGVRLTG